MLEVRHLNASYGQAQALFDVSFQVPAGQMVLIQGLNGAGKSTLLKSIMGLMSQVSGELVWNGHPLHDLKPHQRSALGLGYVPEDRRLFAALTVRQNLEIAIPKVASCEVSAPLSLDHVLDLFPALRSMLDRPAAQMSGGEQQMLALGRTLMTQAKMLLLDEPCEGISPVLVQAIANALDRLKQQGMTLLIAEQNQTLSVMADQVLHLVSGSLVKAR
ncbi:MAG: High-affinity branched-chain amino acid transport ATP-binding protein LivF [Pseudomonadota bacterium]|jgi:branched-chain amino acid transport system ATP-binding protein